MSSKNRQNLPCVCIGGAHNPIGAKHMLLVDETGIDRETRVG